MATYLLPEDHVVGLQEGLLIGVDHLRALQKTNTAERTPRRDASE